MDLSVASPLWPRIVVCSMMKLTLAGAIYWQRKPDPTCTTGVALLCVHFSAILSPTPRDTGFAEQELVMIWPTVLLLLTLHDIAVSRLFFTTVTLITSVPAPDA